MISSEIMDLINAVEEQFPISEWGMDNISIWPIIRIPFIIRVLTQDNLAYASSATPADNSSRILKYAHRISTTFIPYFQAYVKDYSHHCSPKTNVTAMFYSDGISYSYINNCWIEKFCDPLIMYFARNHLTTFLFSPLDKYFIPRCTSSFFIQPFIDFYKLKSRFMPTKSLRKHLPSFSEVASHLNRFCHTQQLLELDSLEKNVRMLRTLRELYKRFLDKLSPTFCFVVSYYNIEGMALNLACRELGITSIDIQHGIQGTLHPAYGRWHNIPSDGYALLPSIFWVWSTEEKRAIEAWSLSVSPWHKAVVGGHPFLEFWHKSAHESIRRYDQHITTYQRNHPKMSQILYTFNGYETPARLTEIVRLMKKVVIPSWWWLRCHPCHLSQKQLLYTIIREVDLTNAELDMATDFPLYAVLKHIDLNITEASSTIVEAEYFQIPSIITSPYGAELFAPQILSGIAKTAFTDEEFLSAISLQLEMKSSLTNTPPCWGSIQQGMTEIFNIMQEFESRSSTNGVSV